HLLPLAPTSLAALAVVATSGGAGLGRALLAGLLLASLGRAVPTLPVLAAASVSNGTAPRVPRLDLRWDLLDVDRLTRLPDVIAALHGRRRVAGFPALGVLNFALGEPSPRRHDYFFPGRPGDRGCGRRRHVGVVRRDGVDIGRRPRPAAPGVARRRSAGRLAPPAGAGDRWGRRGARARRPRGERPRPRRGLDLDARRPAC